MTLVNGYVCMNCTDVERAQHGVDPAQPKGDETKSPFASGKTEKSDGTEKLGDLEQGNRKRSDFAANRADPTEKLGENRPVEAGTLGTRLNLFA